MDTEDLTVLSDRFIPPGLPEEIAEFETFASLDQDIYDEYLDRAEDHEDPPNVLTVLGIITCVYFIGALIAPVWLL